MRDARGGDGGHVLGVGGQGPPQHVQPIARPQKRPIVLAEIRLVLRAAVGGVRRQGGHVRKELVDPQRRRDPRLPAGVREQENFVQGDELIVIGGDGEAQRPHAEVPHAQHRPQGLLLVGHKGGRGIDVVDGHLRLLRGPQHRAELVHVEERFAAADVHGGRAQRPHAQEDLLCKVRRDVVPLPVRRAVVEAVPAPRRAAVVHHQAARGQFEDPSHALPFRFIGLFLQPVVFCMCGGRCTRSYHNTTKRGALSISARGRLGNGGKRRFFLQPNDKERAHPAVES